MSRLYLGIDTSNYRTSAAIFDCDHGTYQNCGRILDVPDGKLGLRQSEALFQHTLHLHEQIARLTAGIGREVQAVCVSTRPRAVEGSYMPCFLAGENVRRICWASRCMPHRISRGIWLPRPMAQDIPSFWGRSFSPGICRAAQPNSSISFRMRPACRRLRSSAVRPIFPQDSSLTGPV